MTSVTSATKVRVSIGVSIFFLGIGIVFAGMLLSNNKLVSFQKEQYSSKESPTMQVAESSSPQINKPPSPQYKPGELLITFTSRASDEKTIQKIFSSAVLAPYPIKNIRRVQGRTGNIQTAVSTHTVEITNRFPKRSNRAVSMHIPFPTHIDTVFTITFENSDVPLDRIIEELRNNSAIKIVEPNYFLELTYIPNDEFFSSTGSWGQPYDDLWGLKKIEAPTAWDTGTGEGIVVAVLDSGLDYTHPDIQSNVFVNQTEQDGSAGIDDDANGFIDDIYGYDFFNKDSDPMDDNGHGTHVAGTIAAVGDNGIGIIGVAPQAKIMSVKVGSSKGAVPSDALAEGVYYATDMGADIINMSLTGMPTQISLDAMQYAAAHGVLLVAAAGNDGLSAGDRFPANVRYGVAVAASTPSDQMADFSNWGWLIDIAAPGGDSYQAGGAKNNILSLRANGVIKPDISVPFPDGLYMRMRGTSMASPHVAGAAALLLSVYPQAATNQIEQAIKLSGDMMQDGYRRINVAKALSFLELPWKKTCTGIILNPRSDELIQKDETTITFTVGGGNEGKDTVHFVLKGGPGVHLDSTDMQVLQVGQSHDVITLNTSLNNIEGPYTLSLEVYDGAYTNLCAVDKVVFHVSHRMFDVTIEREPVSQEFGSAFSQIHGFNGPGSTALIIATRGALVDFPVSWNKFYEIGHVYIIPGNSLQNKTYNIFDPELQMIDLSGEHQEDAFGFSVSGEGDIDGDGLGDLLISAPYYHCENTASCGKIYLILGKDIGDLTSAVDAAEVVAYSWVGSSLHPYIGVDVKWVQDLDGDGRSDFMFVNGVQSESGENKQSMFMNVVFSSDMDSWTTKMDVSSTLKLSINGTTSYILNSTLQFSDLGDFSGDGLAEILVGYERYHKIFGMEVHKDKATPDILFDLPDNGKMLMDPGFKIFDNFGKIAIGGCDLNGDMIHDVVGGRSGSVYYNINSALYLYNGKELKNSNEEATILQLGKAGIPMFAYGNVTCLGDYNADGKDDLAIVIGDAIYLLLGQSDLSHYTDGTPQESFSSFWRTLPLSVFIAAHDIAGLDLNGDQIGDIVIGAKEKVFIDYGSLNAIPNGDLIVNSASCGSGAKSCIIQYTIGSPCNDSNTLTMNDTITESGFCKGEVDKSKKGGLPCDDQNPLTIDDQYTAVGECVGTLKAGLTCDDQNPCTYHDVQTAQGICEGTSVRCFTPPTDICFDPIGECSVVEGKPHCVYNLKKVIDRKFIAECAKY